MEFTKNKNDFNQYMYLKLSGNIVAQRSILSLIVQPKYQMKNNTDNILYQEEETLIDIVVSGTEIEKPILKRNQYTWKSIAKSKQIFNRLLRGIENTKENRGAMVFDFDSDGDLDVFVVNHAEKPSLYRNDGGNYYDYIRVEVKEVCGRDSIGAKVYLLLDKPNDGGDDTSVINEQIREIGNSAAFLGQSEAVAHFGLGLRRDPVYRIRIIWPKINNQPTIVQSIYEIPVRSHLILYRNNSMHNTVSSNKKEQQSSYYYETNAIDLEICTRRYDGNQNVETNIEVKDSDVLSAASLPTATTSSVNNNSTKLFIHKLRQRFQKATNFFLQKMEDIDHILGKKEDLKLSDNKFIEMLEQKYPMMRV